MEQIINLIKEKTGISEEQAKTAVNTVVNFLKEKMPGGIGEQVESFIKSGGSLGDTASSMKDKLGGMFK